MTGVGTVSVKQPRVRDKRSPEQREFFTPAVLTPSSWNVPNTTDTRFRLASVSKQFCTMLVMQLVQEGKIQLDDKITDYLPYYRKDTGSRISLHHLMWITVKCRV